MKTGGMAKAKKYREGGRVSQGMQSPAAGRARSEMSEDAMRRERAREPIDKMERRRGREEEMNEPGLSRDIEDMQRRRSLGYKKGGKVVAKKKGGMIKAKRMK